MNTVTKRLILIMAMVTACCVTQARDRRQELAAMDVIGRQMELSGNKLKVRVVVSGRGQAYSYRMHNGTLTIRATNGVAACRGFYDYLKSLDAGISTWSYSRTDLPSHPHDTAAHGGSPFEHFTYMNVVTYGYSCPFWDEARWDREIDWMALHGIDMPLVLIGAEQVYREVFYDMGLTKEEVDEWEVGPAHLPWFRMGNLSGNSFDGPLGEEWNQQQRRLCRHVLERMRSLGMEPICPAFGGFVPPAFARRTAHTDTTGWDWMPRECSNYRIDPLSPEFVEIGRRFVEKWEQHYGKGKYYISDSFNEMEVPDDLETLTRYGDSVYSSITKANRDAVWVTQGWTFVWQYGQWGSERFKALTKNIPNEKMLVLYMSPEYDPARYWNREGDPCYKNYEGFSGKKWAYTLLPNMGGKNFYTGELKKYGDEFPKEAAQNATSYGITAEGIENNEMLYELICDAGWGQTTEGLEDWMERYARCRYGECTPEIEKYLATLANTVYGRYIDHPRFGWQNGAVLTSEGSAVMDRDFHSGLEELLAQADRLPKSEALAYDLAEAASLYLGGLADQYGAKINDLLPRAADPATADSIYRLIEKVDHTLMVTDSVISIHPQNLEQWVKQAAECGTSPSVRERNIRNAKRIVTIWYGNHRWNEPVQDYAAKIWAGLVRDYYRPRVVGAWRNKVAKAVGEAEPFDQTAFENDWVDHAPMTKNPELGEDKIRFIADAVRREAKSR